MPISVGVRAPDFTLKQKTAEGLQDVTLSANFGKNPVVLLFFPSAYTGVCTKEMCDEGGGLREAQKLGAVVYGISTDSPFAQEAWVKQAGIAVPILSDYDHSVIKAYEAVWPDFVGLGPSAARASIVIGKDGIVKYSEQTTTLGELPDFEKIKAALSNA